MTKKSTRVSPGSRRESATYHLRLFVAGDEPNSAIAKASLDRICSEHPERDYRVETIDVLQDFRPAIEERVLVMPALVVQGPERRTVIFGNLADAEKVLAALQIAGEDV